MSRVTSPCPEQLQHVSNRSISIAPGCGGRWLQSRRPSGCGRCHICQQKGRRDLECPRGPGQGRDGMVDGSAGRDEIVVGSAGRDETVVGTASHWDHHAVSPSTLNYYGISPGARNCHDVPHGAKSGSRTPSAHSAPNHQVILYDAPNNQNILRRSQLPHRLARPALTTTQSS